MLDNSNKLPLYSQLVNVLLEQIKNGLKPNDKLPTENMICEEYSVSRTTVRLALSELEKEGHIYRVQGKGSFVSNFKQRKINSFFEVDMSKNLEKIETPKMSTKIMSIKKEYAQLKTADKMSLQSRDKIIHIKLLHKIGDKPFCLESIFLKANNFINLNPARLDYKNLKELTDPMNISAKFVDETYKVRNLSEEENALLKYKDPVLVVSKYIYNDNNELVIMLQRKMRTDEFTYENFSGMKAE